MSDLLQSRQSENHESLLHAELAVTAGHLRNCSDAGIMWALGSMQ
jgi:hypothetical protein